MSHHQTLVIEFIVVKQSLFEILVKQKLQEGLVLFIGCGKVLLPVFQEVRVGLADEDEIKDAAQLRDIVCLLQSMKFQVEGIVDILIHFLI